MSNGADVTAVVETVQEVLREAGKPVAAMDAKTRLLDDLALDSLNLAAVVVRLEERTGRDPFRDGFVSFATVGELARLFATP